MAVALAPARGQIQSNVSDEAVMQILRPGVAAGLLQIGDRAVGELMVALSVPVEYVDGKIIRSAPGDPPRMEEDLLRQSVDSNLLPSEPLPSLRVSAGPRPGGDADAAVVLEFGGVSSWGGVPARPFMTPQKLRIAVYAAEEIAAGIKRTLGNKH